MSTARQVDTGSVVDALVRGGLTVRADAASLAACARNFGGGGAAPPVAVVEARSTDEVRRALAVSRSRRVPLAFRGAGHGTGELGLAPGGIVVVNAAAGRPRLHGEVVVAATGTRWAELEHALGAAGRASPVLTGNDAVTLGGTLSVGGFGQASFSRGAQVDQVLRMRLLLADGRAVDCSPEREPELFGLALAGAGQIGFISEVELRTVPGPERPRFRAFAFDDAEGLIAAMARARRDGGVTHFSGHRLGGRWIGLFGAADGEGVELSASTPGWDPRAARAGDVARDWCDYVVALREAPTFVRALSAQVIDEDAFARLGGSTLVLGVRTPEPSATPILLSPVTAAMAPMAVLVGIYLDAAPAALARGLQRRALELCLAHGGRPYLAGARELTEQDKRRAFGGALTAVRRLRRRLDPEELVNPGSRL